MKFLLLILTAIPIFASNLLTYNIYERGDRVDIMLSFDSPYEGSIKQQQSKDMINLILSDLGIEQEINKSINSPIIQNLYIAQNDKSSTKVELKFVDPISITASKTSDKFGLRIRVIKLKAMPNTAPVIPANIQTRDQTNAADIDTKYMIVIGILFILVVVLLVVKKMTLKYKNKLNQPFSIKETPSKAKAPSWEFKKGGGNIEIMYEKELDGANKVALLSYENRKYLVLFGSSNVLLDKFGEDKISNEDDFEVFFEENRQKLGKYLEDRKNSLNSYKDMMSV